MINALLHLLGTCTFICQCDLDQEATKGLFRPSNQAVTCYYHSTSLTTQKYRQSL